MGLLIKGGRVVDPAGGIEGILDILVEGDKIAAVGAGIPGEDHKVVVPSGSGDTDRRSAQGGALRPFRKATRAGCAPAHPQI